jgi:polysaccharide biosynthesis/export protein
MVALMRRTNYVFSCIIAAAGLTAAIGCQSVPRANYAPAREAAVAPMQNTVPRELCKVVLPQYTLEPPDVLMIDAVHVVPKAPYRLRTLDALAVQVQGTLPDEPINAIYPIKPGGILDLGFSYGTVKVGGLYLDDATKVIKDKLSEKLRNPSVSVSLADIASKQQIAGQHLVGPDGTVTLGTYGSVLVVGMTIPQAKAAIEKHLSKSLEDPEVSLDVFAYNSKVYYIVTQGAGLGDGVYRFPVTGNETVLDAIAHINGLGQVSSKEIWIARPTDDPAVAQILPVSWDDITAQAAANTNYQILPGDRVFVAENKLVALDTGLAKIIAPLERVMGFSLLGVGTATRFSGHVLQGGGNPQGTF